MEKNNSVEQISILVLENFEKIADVLEIAYAEYDNRIVMPCPVHGGDNNSACVIFKDGRHIRGNWSCFTHSCQEQYGISIVGFLRGVLETRTNKEQSFKDVVEFIEGTLTCSVKSIIPRKDNFEFREFAKQEKLISKRQLITNIKIPSQYYVRRGYTKSVLNKYSVGFCNTKGKPFYLRTVVPVFNEEESGIVGVIGRTINEKCPKCGWYHYAYHRCPETGLEKYFASKWINSKGFCKTDYLYNSWSARPYIEDSKTAIVVESVGNVWRLVENGVHNCVAIFGSSLSSRQEQILRSMNVKNLVLMMDNDSAGHNAVSKTSSRLKLDYNIFYPDWNIYGQHNDIGDMSNDYTKEHVLQWLHKFNLGV